MKQIQKYTVIAGLAIVLATPAFAADWRKNKPGGGTAAQAAPQIVARPAPQIPHVAAPARQFSGGNPGFRANTFHAAQPGVVSRSPAAVYHPAATRTFAAPARRVTTPSFAATAPANNRFIRNHVNNGGVSPQLTNAVPPQNSARTFGNNRFNRNRLNNGGMSPQLTNVGTPQNGTRTFGNNRFGRNRGNNTGVSPQFANGRGGRNNTAFNRANRYGGNWFAADSHRDWNRDGEHFWHHHHFRWFDGGWLIVDNGFWPYDYADPYYANDGYYYNQPTYYAGDSTAADVQSKLADLGYYNGPIDGDIGPMSRNAIAEYQGDNGLPVTGRIDEPLLESLGLA